ncbi:MAG: HEPN domain-containing protein [Candidatus Paceibacterota bacterium]|jgi:uncharacterized protein (UPF0332 family)
MSENQIKDKSIFVVGILATFLAFSTLKEELQRIIVLSTPTRNVSFFDILVIFVSLLTISVYMYALDFVKYNYGPRIQNHLFFKAIIWLANFFYSFAIFFPIFIVIIIIFQIPIIDNLTKRYNGLIWLFDVIMGLIWLITSVWNTFFINRKRKEDSMKILEKNAENTLENATKMLRDKYYSSSIIESYKVLVLNLRKILLQKDILTENTSDPDIKALALKFKIIPEELVANFNDITAMRNRAVHLDVTFTKEQVELVINTVNQILTKIAQDIT